MEMDSGAPLGGGALFYLRASRRKSNCGTILLMDMLTRRGSETAWIVDRAKAEGFDLCGVVRAEKFPELAHTPEWLERGYAGEMNYLSDPRRSDPQSVLKGTRSVIVCALNYNTAKSYSTVAAADLESGEPRGWISRYAWGQDYHEVLREKLESLVTAIRKQYQEPFEARVYADTGPLQERILAKYAGLGWIGKNTLLLNQSLGSFFFLGVILTTLELAPTLAAGEAPSPDLCGTCRRCIDECPTEALVEPYVMDARRCISYLTIELRGSIPEELREPMGWQVFGCDICQDVCPWNRKAPVTEAAQFQARVFAADEGRQTRTVDLPGSEQTQEQSLYLPALEWLAGMSEKEFQQFFRDSPVKRTKWRGLVRNACIALGNSSLRRNTPGHERILALLERLSASAEPLISESARWALARVE
jgi:epoxyqueuosine reductase